MTRKQALGKEDWQTINAALHRAGDWESSLAECWGNGTPEKARALAEVERFKSLSIRLFGPTPDPMADFKPVTLQEIAKRAKVKYNTTQP